MKAYFVYYLGISTESGERKSLRFPAPILAESEGKAVEQVISEIQKHREVEYQYLTPDNWAVVEVDDLSCFPAPFGLPPRMFEGNCNSASRVGNMLIL